MVNISGITQVAQRVDDLERAVEFYRDTLGLDLIARFDPPGLAFFRLDNARLLLEAGAPPSMIYLAVDDIDACIISLRNNDVEIVSEPHLIHRDEEGLFGAPGSEEWMAFFSDSEGNTVGLIETRGP